MILANCVDLYMYSHVCTWEDAVHSPRVGVVVGVVVVTRVVIRRVAIVSMTTSSESSPENSECDMST